MKKNNITAAILAGGKNERMGFNKAFLEVNSKRIIDLTLEALKPVFKEVLIVTNDRDSFSGFEDVRIVEDLVKGCGPLGGIYTGLMTSSYEGVFFVACDMPFLHTGFINGLLAIAEKGDFDCVIPCSDKGIEPLHGIYYRRILPRIENLLAKKRFSIKHLLEQCNCEYVASRSEEVKYFFNLNTPEDLERVSRQ